MKNYRICRNCHGFCDPGEIEGGICHGCRAEIRRMEEDREMLRCSNQMEKEDNEDARKDGLCAV